MTNWQSSIVQPPCSTSKRPVSPVSEVCLCLCKLYAAKFLFSPQALQQDRCTNQMLLHRRASGSQAAPSRASLCLVFIQLSGYSFNGRRAAAQLAQISPLRRASASRIKLELCFSREILEKLTAGFLLNCWGRRGGIFRMYQVTSP